MTIQYDTLTPVGVESAPLIKKRSRNKGRSLKIQKTLVLCYAYICLGLTISVLGPSLLALAHNLHKELDEVNFIFLMRGTGYMATTIVIGFILDKFSVSSATSVAIPENPILKYLMYRLNAILFIASIAVMGLSMFAMPFITNYALMLTVNVFCGIAGGIIDCVASVVMLWTWGEETNNYMQGLHAMFGLGSFLGPFFLQIVTNVLKNLGLRVPWYVNPLSITYWTMGVFMMTSLLLFLFIPFVDVKAKKVDVTEQTEVKVGWTDFKNWDWKQIIAGLLSSLSLFFYCGVEAGYGSYISPYVTLYQREHFRDTAALIASIFWLSFTLGRLIALPLSYYLSIRQTLMLNSIFCIASLLVMALVPNYIALWVTCVTFGFAMASQYPTTLSAPTSHLNIDMAASMTSFTIFLANLGSTVSVIATYSTLGLSILFSEYAGLHLLDLCRFYWS
jgi:FHS family Na+ dependent glucose MFS transporter 1